MPMCSFFGAPPLLSNKEKAVTLHFSDFAVTSCGEASWLRDQPTDFKVLGACSGVF